MLNSIPRAWLIGGWLMTFAVIIAFSVAIGARLSTSGLLLVIGVVPAIVMMFIVSGGPSPTVAEVLRSAEGTDGR